MSMANLSLKRGTTERTSWSEYGWTENVRGEEMGTSIVVAENSLRVCSDGIAETSLSSRLSDCLLRR